MNHRVFIAINLPNEIRKALVHHQEKIEQSFVANSEEAFSGPVRWTKKDNLHVTLIFLGQISDEELWEACKTVKEVASKIPEFSVSFKKITYGPPQKGKEKAPRMVWVQGEKSEDLGMLQNELEGALLSSPIKPLKEGEKRSYAPHITLGRIKAWEWNKINPEERIDLNEEININFDVVSIDVMESELKRGGGPIYTVLESCQLKN
jgi:2'-5' RNA ligase